MFYEWGNTSKPPVQALRKHGARKKWKTTKDLTQKTGEGKYLIKKHSVLKKLLGRQSLSLIRKQQEVNRIDTVGYENTKEYVL